MSVNRIAAFNRPEGTVAATTPYKEVEARLRVVITELKLIAREAEKAGERKFAKNMVDLQFAASCFRGAWMWDHKEACQ